MAGGPPRRGATTDSKYWRRPTRESARVRIYDHEKVTSLLASPPPPGGSGGHTAAEGFFFSSSSRTEEEQKPASSRRKQEEERAKALEELRLKKYERKREEMLRKQDEQERAVREKIVANQALREKKFAERRKDIAEGHKLADDVDRYLSLAELSRRTKLKKQFDEWNVGVYGKVQDQINDTIDAMTDDDVNKKRRQAFQRYLDASNAKGSAIFRDIIIESEYDPLEPNRNCVKADATNIQDPLKRVLDKHHEETTMLDDDDDDDDKKKTNFVGGHNKPKPRRRTHGQTRDMLQPTSWGTGKIEATPHGYFAKLMDRNGEDPGAQSTSNKTYASQIPCFDHFNVPKGKHLLDAEFPCGKRVFHIPGEIESLA